MRQFTVSLRDKHEFRPVLRFLRNQFGSIPLAEIESVWGFVEPCALYGGREFIHPQLSDRDVEILNEAGIGLRLPLTNHFCEDKDYRNSLWLLDKYHNDLNSVIVTNDTLALQIQRDFPKYAIEASVIKNLRFLKTIEKALELYDTVVIPMDMNDDKDFLESLPKDKIRLFANAACAYTCPSKVCYASFSKINRGDDIKAECSMDTKPRPFEGVHNFDVGAFEDMGFIKFKLLRNG